MKNLPIKITNKNADKAAALPCPLTKKFLGKGGAGGKTPFLKGVFPLAIFLSSLLLVPSAAKADLIGFTPMSSALEYAGLNMQGVVLQTLLGFKVIVAGWIVVHIAWMLANNEGASAIGKQVLFYLIALSFFATSAPPKVGTYSAGTLKKGTDTTKNEFSEAVAGTATMNQKVYYPSRLTVFIAEVIDEMYYTLMDNMAGALSITDDVKMPFMLQNALLQAMEARMTDPYAKASLRTYLNECFEKGLTAIGESNKTVLPNTLQAVGTTKSPMAWFLDAFTSSSRIDSALASQKTNLLNTNTGVLYNCLQLRNDFAQRIKTHVEQSWTQGQIFNSTVSLMTPAQRAEYERMHVPKFVAAKMIVNYMADNPVTEATGGSINDTTMTYKYSSKIGSWAQGWFDWLNTSERTSSIPFFGESAWQRIKKGYSQQFQFQNFMNKSAIYQGFGLFLLHTVAGGIPYIMIIMGGFGVLRWYVMALLWIKSWPLCWIMIIKITKGFTQMDQLGQSLESLGVDFNLDVISSMHDQIYNLQESTEQLLTAVPFVTAIVFGVGGVGLLAARTMGASMPGAQSVRVNPLSEAPDNSTTRDARRLAAMGE